ncbi:MAG TPA: RibD family protein [Gammaproteobacteria bacterium]
MSSSQVPSTDATAVSPGASHAWALLQAVRAHARRGAAPAHGAATALRLARGSTLVPCDPEDAWLVGGDGGLEPGPAVPPAERPLLELYLPVALASAAAPVVVGHLGQSLDGYIATGTGDSYYVTGPANVVHLHRMRALCDAVVVGAETILTDDPQLTARRAAGPNPVRVVLDPRRRLGADYRVFQDGQAETLLVCDRAHAEEGVERLGNAAILPLPSIAGRIEPRDLLAALHERGLHAVFVEGGGKTVSTFLDAGVLDRLQIAIAPLIIGAGRPGIQLGPRDRIGECTRLAHRVFAMGRDVLFDCDLRRPPAADDGEEPRRVI